MPFQSILTLESACACVPRLRTGGLPATGPPGPLYPGLVGTATPATVGATPHPSTPLRVPALPFFCSPVRLVQPERALMLPLFHVAYSATVRSPWGVPVSAA